jgi:prefoldin subunit 5
MKAKLDQAKKKKQELSQMNQELTKQISFVQNELQKTKASMTELKQSKRLLDFTGGLQCK